MSIWDWVQGGLGCANTSLADFKGSYKVTAGTGLSACFGGRHTHVFGPEIKLVVDPEDMLAQIVPPGITALTSGLTSNATFVYGSSTSATYIGPKVDIQRAPKITRVSKKLNSEGPGVKSASEATDAADRACAIAVAVLSLLAVAAAASMEMYMYIHYRDFTDSTKGPGGEPKRIAVASYMVPSRLLALIKVIETWACYGSWAEVSVIGAASAAAAQAVLMESRILISKAVANYNFWQWRRQFEANLALQRAAAAEGGAGA